MKISALIFVLLRTALLAAPVSIFDGESLDGWEGDAKLWRVEGGMITGGSLVEKVAHNDFIATRKAYANFDLRLKIRLSGTEGLINSGVQIRSVRVPGSHEMSGYQVDYGKGWYGKLYDESRRNKVIGQAADLKAATAAIKEGDWNEYRIRAEGPRIQSWINGVPALDYTEADGTIVHDGQIGIQVHGGGKALVQVKDVMIEELPEPSPVKVKIEGAELAPPGFAAAAEKTLKAWYPRVRHILGADYATPEEITLRFRDFDGVARTTGAVIEASTKFFSKHPDDVGAVLHELVHVIQAYPPGAPGWLVEGIADYVRYYYYEPAKGAAFRAKPGQGYKDGYNPAAALLASAQIGKAKAILAELNRRGHAGKLTEEVFKEIAGQTPDEVWSRVPGNKGPASGKPAPKPMKEGNAANSTPKTPEEERALLKVPEGFEIELIAAEDPANGIGKFVPLAFDQRGALWTTTALEYPVDGNENPAAADALYASKAKDKVLVYDRDPKSPTGYAGKPRVFADGLAIPLGVLPYKNGCYVQHGHDIAFLEDTDGDGRADKRTVILTGFGVQDSHLFPHQFLRAPGGWIWMAQGAFNYSKVSRPGDEKNAVQFDQTRMAKFRPDGSQFTITSNGPCNIWGLVLNGEGEAFIQEANDFGHPVMPFHEYANYPGCSERQWKSYAPEFPGTAPDFKMGGTGLSGLALTDKAGPFPEPWRDVMLVANPITNRINAIKMHRDGPRWRLEKLADFMESGDPCFRPVAISIGPDGCLYIVDWYNKIISHNEVPRNHPDRDKTRGRIWRVKAKAAKPFDVPDFTKLSGDELIAKLGGPSLAQHHLAWQAIVDRDIKDLAPKLHEIVAGRTTAANTNVEPRANANPRPDVSRETRDTAGGTPTLPDATRIAALWASEERGVFAFGGYDYEWLRSLSESPNRNLRREIARFLGDARLHSFDAHGLDWTRSLEILRRLSGDADSDVRSASLCSAGSALDDVLNPPDPEERHKDVAADAIRTLLSTACEPLASPTAPSTRNGKTIKVREAYEREFERYLVRMFLERHPDAVAKFLDSDAAKPLPVEARLLATLALEPRASVARMARLLPQLQRAPGQEEMLRLAQFPDEPGVGEALRAILSNATTRGAALESLLAVKTRLDATKLTPLLSDAATALLTSKDAGSVELATRLAGAFQLGGMEAALASTVEAGISEIHDWVKGEPAHRTRIELSPSALQALRALHEMRSGKVELFERLVRLASNSDVRDEALAALAGSKAADAPARVLALYPKLTPSQQRSALERLSATKPGAGVILAALNDGKLAASDLDASILDRLQAVLGANDPALAKLVDRLGALFRPVLALDGSEAAWTQTNVTLEGPCTIEAWVRLDPEKRKIGNADGIAGAPGQIDFNFFGELARIYAFPPLGNVVVAKKPITPGVWTHVAASRDAKGIWKIHMDGELSGTGTKPAPSKIENVRIAWTAANGGTRGALSEVRLWNRERSADEIRAASDRSIDADGRRQALPPNGEGNAGAPSKASPPPSVGGYEGLVFASVSGDWGNPQAGAKVIKTSDYPPILTGDEAAALDAKYAKFRSLAEKPGDPAKGKLTAVICQACHLMGTAGGNIGPNLSGVGAMGTEAILRNMIQPNAAMENGYRIYRIELKSGDLVDALFVSEDKAAVVVRLPGADDRRIAKSDIRSAKFLRRSLMAEGLLDGMTPEQVSDLFAYLKTLK